MNRERVCPFDPDTPAAEQWVRDYHAKHYNHSWRPKRKKKDGPVIAVIDFETDPFDGPEQTIEPFSVGFYDGVTYYEFWGADCHQSLMDHIKGLENAHIIYAHNGGRFDFSFLLQWIEPAVFMIGNRITKCKIAGQGEIMHELRDSFSAMPVALMETGKKIVFDYDKMKRDKREKFKPEILEYLKQDCMALYEYITAWRAEFGNGLTMASAAIKKLNADMVPENFERKTLHVRLTPEQDEKLRAFYYGGRVECFERGILEGDFQIHDITSSYPNVMAKYQHPISAGYKRGLREITEKTDFANIVADSQGALPLRDMKSGKLMFPHGVFEFHATGHEIRAALELGLLKIHKVNEAMEANERSNFSEFVYHYFNKRVDRKAECVRLGIDPDTDPFVLFWKLVLNSAYGKYAINPRKFKDRLLCRIGDPAPDYAEGWVLSARYKLMDVYERQSDQTHAWRSYMNVGTGASITGAARAELLKGLARSQRPIYCDTDSIICEGLLTGDQVPGALGSWKLEGQGDLAAICERKLYAVFNRQETDEKTVAKRMRAYGHPDCIKLASKGVRVSAYEVLKVAQGEIVEYKPLAPTIKLDGSQIWTNRRIKMTSAELPPQQQTERLQPAA